MKNTKMIRNLLYSICLHLLFVLLIMFSDKINNMMSNNMANINILNVDFDFLEKNDIKTTDIDNYPDLTLKEKIELYNLSKENYDKNKEFSKIDRKALGSKLKYTNDIKVEMADGKYFDGENISINKNEILYLGPTDYKKFMEKLEKEREEREKQEVKRAKEENKKLDNLINKIGETTVARKKIEEKDEKTEEKKSTAEIKLKLVSDENKQDIYETNERNKEIDNKIIEILAIKNDEDGEREIIAGIDGEEDPVVTSEEEVVESFNIDINKIFTREDIRNIKKYLKDEMNLQSLSVREKVNIQNQIVMCYKNAIIQTGKNNKVKVSVVLKLFQDGIIDTKEIKIKIIDDKNLFNKDDYDEAIENIKLALAYCNPLRNLPIAKYQSWQNINFIFDATTIK